MQEEFPNPQTTRKGVEWAWVIAIVAVLVGTLGWFLFPKFQDAKKAAAISFESLSVKKVDLALIQYMGDHGDRYPNLSGDMVTTLRPYINDPKVIEAMRHFVWNDKLSGKKEDSLDYDPEKMWMLYSKVSGLSRCVVGFVDGHVQDASDATLSKIVENGDQMLRTAQSKTIVERDGNRSAHEHAGGPR